MPLKQTIKERMIPIENYATISPDATLREAALSLRKSFFELDGGMRTVAGPRAVLVTDIMLKVKGAIDVSAIVEEGLKIIVQNKISILPVYDGDKAVGIIRDTDIFLAITDSLEKGN